ncbi:unnamed protein product [Prunus brigantina]
MEDLELRFGVNLRLSDRERQGVQIGENELGSQFVGHRNTLVAKVLSHQVVNKEGFLSSFSRLWRGIAEVSIREIADKLFLVRFENHRDKARVLDMEPWTYRDSLVLLSEVTVGCDFRSVDLKMGVFWVQLHGIPPLTMTVAVARKIGSLLGQVAEVDHADGEDCIGRFARVRIQFDVTQPLMRGAFVEFPEVGSVWISFLYEFLPEYCFICGCLGHPSRICLEKAGESSSPRCGVESLYAFAGLEAVEDMRGRALKSVLRRAAQGSPNAGSWRPRSQHAPERRLSLADSIRKQRELDSRRTQARTLPRNDDPLRPDPLARRSCGKRGREVFYSRVQGCTGVFDDETRLEAEFDENSSKRRLVVLEEPEQTVETGLDLSPRSP